MDTISKHINPSGITVYRAVIRIRKNGYPNLTESRTFSKKSMAAEWVKRREAETELNPDILFGQKNKLFPTLHEAVDRYLAEIANAGRSKQMGLRSLLSFPIGSNRINRLRRADFAEHVMLRRRGMPQNGIKPIAASTALQELQYTRTVLKHAFYVWDMPVSWQELDFAAEGLDKSGIIAKSTKRNRLPTSDELQRLATFFYQNWTNWRQTNLTPMHLIMWLAIYATKRQDEICRMMLDDYHPDSAEWLIRDVKHPQGSKGNDKKFDVRLQTLPVIAALLEPETRRRILKCNRTPNNLVPLDPKSINAAFTCTCHALGIDDLRFHDLRHEDTARLAEDGVTPPQMQMVALYNTWVSLERYVNPRKRPQRLEFDEAIKDTENDLNLS